MPVTFLRKENSTRRAPIAIEFPHEKGGNRGTRPVTVATRERPRCSAERKQGKKEEVACGSAPERTRGIEVVNYDDSLFGGLEGGEAFLRGRGAPFASTRRCQGPKSSSNEKKREKKKSRIHDCSTETRGKRTVAITRVPAKGTEGRESVSADKRVGLDLYILDA